MPAWMRYVVDADPSRFVAFGRDVFGIAPADSSDEAIKAAALETIDRLQEFFVRWECRARLRNLA